MTVRIYISRKAAECKRLLDRMDLGRAGYGLKNFSSFSGLEAELRTPFPDRSLFVVCPGDLSELTTLAELQSQAHPKPLILILPQKLGKNLDPAYRCRPRMVFRAGDGLSEIQAVLLRMIGTRVALETVKETAHG